MTLASGGESPLSTMVFYYPGATTGRAMTQLERQSRGVNPKRKSWVKREHDRRLDQTKAADARKGW